MHVTSAKLNRTEPIDSSIEIQSNHLNFMRRCWSIDSELRSSVGEVINCVDEMRHTEYAVLLG
ncbi:hypothetical protein C8R48DRAFT_730097 [Suillus tomentosus]|nr:hypothetical protein C8R48DRAFT_730097 [Suillus tomentosus]